MQFFYFVYWIKGKYMLFLLKYSIFLEKNKKNMENFGFLLLRSDLLSERGDGVTNCEHEVVL